MKMKLGVIAFGTAMLLAGCGAGTMVNLQGKTQAFAASNTTTNQVATTHTQSSQTTKGQSSQSKATTTQAKSTSGNNAKVTYAFTRAGQNPEGKLISVINSTHHTLDVAIYSLTNPWITQAIVNAKQRGVKVRVMTDRSEASSSYQKPMIERLLKAGIPVKENTHYGIMHLKVAIADGKEVTTGSYNYTKSASEYNDEVFVVIQSQKITQAWEQEFEHMWTDTHNYTTLTSTMLAKAHHSYSSNWSSYKSSSNSSSSNSSKW